MSTPKILALIGGILVAFGVVAGLLPISAQGMDCGSAWRPAGLSDFLLENMVTGRGTSGLEACKDARSARGPLSTGPAVVGGLLLALAGFLAIYAMPRGDEPLRDGVPYTPED